MYNWLITSTVGDLFVLEDPVKVIMLIFTDGSAKNMEKV